MIGRGIERQLKKTSKRLVSLRGELGIVDEQLLQLRDEASDAELRAIVSETPGVGYEHRKAAEHAQAMAAHRAKVVDEITRLERRQDELLDRLSAG